MRRRNGFTLLEVVVAGGLLAIGMLALVTLQAQALRAQRRVTVVRQLVAAAEAELDRQLAMPAPSVGACTTVDGGSLATCRVDVESCNTTEEGLCGRSDSSRLARVVVTVGAAGQEFVLSALHGPSRE